MSTRMRRAVACATALAAAAAVLGVTSTSGQAAGTDREAARYAAIVQDDPTAAIDSNGRVYYTEPVPSAAALRAQRAAPRLAPQFPLSQTFRLHSQPGSNRTILLDFDGATVSGSAWNSEGLPNGSHPAWTLDGNAGSFNDNERAVIQEVWQRVAEDFAPFDVDVTTEDLGADRITRSGSGDQVFGSRALITPSNAVENLCDGQCVGIAYLDVFDQVGGRSQPVWVFPQHYQDNAKGIAETVSHEVGHNLNLEHDGNSEEGYDSGHAPWAPIMGNSDHQPISQWSKGDYADADNQQDDFAVIQAAGLSPRADDAGNSVGSATALSTGTGTGYITNRTDKDFWALGQCSGAVKVTATGVAVGTNLDIELRLYDAGGTQVAINNPPSARVDAHVASGMNATINTSVAAGQYVAAVDGVGNGNPRNGYDDYASVGAYTLGVTGCEVDPGDGDTPSAPQELSAAPGPSGTAMISWSAPADEGESPVTGYEVTVGGFTDTVDAATFSYTATGLERGATYDVSVVAVNGAGAGAPATTTFTTADVPGQPVIIGAGSGGFGGAITASVRWIPPADDGGSPVVGYVIKGTRWSPSGRALQTGTTEILPADQLSSTLGLKTAGIWSFRVRAINDVGAGPYSKASKKVRGR